MQAQKEIFLASLAGDMVQSQDWLTLSLVGRIAPVTLNKKSAHGLLGQGLMAGAVSTLIKKCQAHPSIDQDFTDSPAFVSCGFVKSCLALFNILMVHNLLRVIRLFNNLHI